MAQLGLDMPASFLTQAAAADSAQTALFGVAVADSVTAQRPMIVQMQTTPQVAMASGTTLQPLPHFVSTPSVAQIILYGTTPYQAVAISGENLFVQSFTSQLSQLQGNIILTHG